MKCDRPDGDMAQLEGGKRYLASLNDIIG